MNASGILTGVKTHKKNKNKTEKQFVTVRRIDIGGIKAVAETKTGSRWCWWEESTRTPVES